MNVEEYISSGELELYIAGLLPAKRNREIKELIEKYPEIKTEAEAIESAILKLSEHASSNKEFNFSEVVRKIILSKDKNSVSIWHYLGWAAAAVFAAIIYFQYLNINDTKKEYQIAVHKTQELEKSKLETEKKLEAIETTFENIRNKEIEATFLAGQNKFSETYAKVYWDKIEGKIYVDSQGLPKPPEGMVYQVWSLQLDPLTPTSLGLLDDFTHNTTQIFTLANSNNSEAFGITLEPAGGSTTPTMEQLYTLGIVPT